VVAAAAEEAAAAHLPVEGEAEVHHQAEVEGAGEHHLEAEVVEDRKTHQAEDRMLTQEYSHHLAGEAAEAGQSDKRTFREVRGQVEQGREERDLEERPLVVAMVRPQSRGTWLQHRRGAVAMVLRIAVRQQDHEGVRDHEPRERRRRWDRAARA